VIGSHAPSDSCGCIVGAPGAAGHSSMQSSTSCACIACVEEQWRGTCVQRAAASYTPGGQGTLKHVMELLRAVLDGYGHG
jgi:hypothetical protein